MRPATSLPLKKACPLEGDLPGSGAVRHCPSCATDVLDLSLLTAREADRRLADPARPRCVSYRVDEAGNVVHLAEPVAPRRRLPLLVGGLLLAACNGSPAESTGGAPVHTAAVTAAASSSAPTAAATATATAPPPAASTEPTEKTTRGEIAAPAASHEEGVAQCDPDGKAAATTDKQGNPIQTNAPKKPKKPKSGTMRGYM